MKNLFLVIFWALEALNPGLFENILLHAFKPKAVTYKI